MEAINDKGMSAQDNKATYQRAFKEAEELESTEEAYGVRLPVLTVVQRDQDQREWARLMEMKREIDQRYPGNHDFQQKIRRDAS